MSMAACLCREAFGVWRLAFGVSALVPKGLKDSAWGLTPGRSKKDVPP